MKTIDKIKVTRSGNVHLLDNEGKVIIKLHSGDAFYTDENKNIYVARKESIEYLNGEIHFDENLPVCKDGADNDEWIELLRSRYVMVICKPAMMFTCKYEQYSMTANIIIAK